MKPAPFDYHLVDSIEAAVALTTEHGDEAKLLAGGQSLVPSMNFRVVQPTVLVDLNGLSDLDYVRLNDEGALEIGAMTRQRRLELDPQVEEHAPLLHEAIPNIAHPQIRARGTLGGSLVHADPAAELPVVVLALEARMRVKGKEGERSISVDDFFQGMFYTDLSPDEILLETVIPAMPARTGWSFKEVARRTGDYAMMGVAALVSLDEEGVCSRAKLVYLNAGDGPVDAREAADQIVGEKPDDSMIDAAAAIASEKEIDPLGNLHASIPFQRHLAHFLTRSALNQALERAQTTLDSD